MNNLQQYLNSLYPKLVRIKRSQGVVTQGCDVYIAHACNAAGWNLKKSKWYIEECIGNLEEYRKYIENNVSLKSQIYELVGQTLGCWCEKSKLKGCHGNVLIDLTKQFINEYFQNTPKISSHHLIPQEQLFIHKHYTLRTVKQYVLNLKPKYQQQSAIARYQSQSQQQQPVQISTKGDNNIYWDNTNNNWIIQNKENVIFGENDITVLIPTTAHFGDTQIQLHENSKVTLQGKVDLYSLVNNNLNKSSSSNISNISNIPEQFNETQYEIFTKHTSNPLKIDDGFLGFLHNTSKVEAMKRYKPFVCKVVARMHSQKTNRYMLQLSDGYEIYKVHVGSQLFNLIKNKFIDKDDIIEVIDYCSTKTAPNKRVVIIFHLAKLVHTIK